MSAAAARKHTFLSTLSWLAAALESHLLTHLSNKLPFLLLNITANSSGAPLIHLASIPRRVAAFVRMNFLACRTNKTALMRLGGGGRKW